MRAAGALRHEVIFMVQDDGPVELDRVPVASDDKRVVSDAGVVGLVAMLAVRLGFEFLVSLFVRLRRDRPGAATLGAG